MLRRIVKIFLTGVDGYIGTLLAPLLMRRGHDVVGVDTGYYRHGWLYSDPESVGALPRTLLKDLRRIDPADLEGFDCVIHLAELSNDPLGEMQPDVTFAINHQASVRLAALAKDARIPRFVYASSCSVYGAGRRTALTEESEPNPQTTYAKCKVMVEGDLRRMADASFSPVFLRNATAFGASPRMRFDIVLNNLCGLARTTRRIVMTSDGTPWRPLVHVLDICKAFACAAEAPREAVHNETFNVGANDQNYQIRDIATTVANEFPGCAVVMGSDSSDRRSYRVAFEKIHRHLSGFCCDWSAPKGAAQLRALFERIDLTSDLFNFPAFTRLEALKSLLRTGQLDRDLFWTSDAI
jgi:nucleoside-diphosphate-sugar epimerase